MTEILITGGIGIVSSIVSAWISWVFARKKYNSEVDGNLIDNMLKSLEFYEALSDDNKQRLDKALEDNAHLRDMVEELLIDNKNLKKEIDNVKDQMLKLTTSICTDLSCQLRSQDFTKIQISSSTEEE